MADTGDTTPAEVLAEAGPGDWEPPSGAQFTRARMPEAAVFLSALARGLTATGAARVAGIARRAAYEWRDDDPVFREAWDAARAAAIDAAEDTMYRRALVGHRKPIVYQGQITGWTYEPSDRLMELLLKAERPDKYRERVDHTVTAVPMSPEQLQAAREAGLRPEVEAAAATLASVPLLPAETGGT